MIDIHLKYKEELLAIVHRSGNQQIDSYGHNYLGWGKSFIDQPINFDRDCHSQSLSFQFLCCWLMARNLKIPFHIHNYIILVLSLPNNKHLSNFLWNTEYLKRTNLK